ncbi:MAG: helix-turn-helix transcriptional regulator [Clostridiaceae bacterium]|nr:helix-turn-helix transcriptional regulator [Clostridiaceae bacterium]
MRKEGIQFDNEKLCHLYEEIKSVFMPYKEVQDNDKVEYVEAMSPEAISTIDYILRKIDNSDTFNKNKITQLCFYQLVYSKVSSIKNGYINHIENDNVREKQSAIVKKWETILETKIKKLQEKIKENYQSIFSDKLVKLMECKKVSQTDLSELLDLHSSRISVYCKGKSFPKDFHTLLQICNLLDCNIQYLFDPDTVLPDVTFQAIYKDIGLSEASIIKLREIRPYTESKAITRDLNILIENIEIDYLSDYDVLSSIAMYLRVHPYNEPKHLISENLLNQYKAEFENITSAEDAKTKFNEFINTLKSESIQTKPVDINKDNSLDIVSEDYPKNKTKSANTSKRIKWPLIDTPDTEFNDFTKIDLSPNKPNKQSFERENILHLIDIQEKLIRLQAELKDMDEPEKYLSKADYMKYEPEMKKMQEDIKEQENRNKQDNDNK